MTVSPDGQPERSDEAEGSSLPAEDAPRRRRRDDDREGPGHDDEDGHVPDRAEPDLPDDGWEPV